MDFQSENIITRIEDSRRVSSFFLATFLRYFFLAVAVLLALFTLLHDVLKNALRIETLRWDFPMYICWKCWNDIVAQALSSKMFSLRRVSLSFAFFVVNIYYRSRFFLRYNNIAKNSCNCVPPPPPVI